MSFLDPYASNRRFSLIGWLRVGVWTLILGIAALLFWWLG
ncbi:MAG: hypothetical protein DHS20C15_17850 [Planctomycetota bacterium]|nr:MAG: hypothetical protein DHS20C15_17850 [Planctomycetota bacterium]